MKLEFITETPQETKALGEKMGSLSKPNMVWTMSGDLGAGKTTLTQGIARGLGITRTARQCARPDHCIILTPIVWKGRIRNWVLRK